MAKQVKFGFGFRKGPKHNFLLSGAKFHQALELRVLCVFRRRLSDFPAGGQRILGEYGRLLLALPDLGVQGPLLGKLALELPLQVTQVLPPFGRSAPECDTAQTISGQKWARVLGPSNPLPQPSEKPAWPACLPKPGLPFWRTRTNCKTGHVSRKHLEQSTLQAPGMDSAKTRLAATWPCRWIDEAGGLGSINQQEVCVPGFSFVATLGALGWRPFATDFQTAEEFIGVLPRC